MRAGTIPETIVMALRRRGITLRRDDGDADGPLLRCWSETEIGSFYQEMQRYSFRLVLRDVIRLGGTGVTFSPDQLTRHASQRAVRGHLEQLMRLSLVERQGEDRYRFNIEINSFGPTLEWFVAEILKRELGFTVARGLPMRGGMTGGDLDVVAMAEGKLFYIEVKSGPPKHLSTPHIAAFLDRVDALAPDGAIFFEDTELRMTDKVVVLFEEVLADKGIPRRPRRLLRELFTVGPGILIANAHPDVTANLSCCISQLLRSQGLKLTVDLAP